MKVNIGTISRDESWALESILNRQNFKTSRFGRVGAYEIRAEKGDDLIIWREEIERPQIQVTKGQLIPLYA